MMLHSPGSSHKSADCTMFIIFGVSFTIRTLFIALIRIRNDSQLLYIQLCVHTIVAFCVVFRKFINKIRHQNEYRDDTANIVVKNRFSQFKADFEKKNE